MAARGRRSEGVPFPVTVTVGTACWRVLPSGCRFSDPVPVRLWLWMGCPDSLPRMGCPDSLPPTGSNSSKNRGRKCYSDSRGSCSVHHVEARAKRLAHSAFTGQRGP